MNLAHRRIAAIRGSQFARDLAARIPQRTPESPLGRLQLRLLTAIGSAPAVTLLTLSGSLAVLCGAWAGIIAWARVVGSVMGLTLLMYLLLLVAIGIAALGFFLGLALLRGLLGERRFELMHAYTQAKSREVEWFRL